MCGIAGVVGAKATSGRAVVEEMLDAIGHRGPDARGTYAEGMIALGHVRMSVMDVDARSNQPFHRGGGVLCYNGELWNFRELRTELEAEGETFVTDGDTEVVAAALESWGVHALDRFNGMFALAWSRTPHDVLLARDRFGEIPLHVAKVGRALFFASELKALPGHVRRHAIWLEPGQYAFVTALGDGVSYATTTYYDADVTPLAVGPEEASVMVRAALEQGCSERAMSDVPVCTLLSGGVDSSAIAALLVKHRPGLVAFTAVMDPASPDLRCARQVAKDLGIRLVEVTVPPPTADDLEAMVLLIESPLKAQVEIAWACTRLADAMKAEGFKVTYSGEGSDELWGSYKSAYFEIVAKGWHLARKETFLKQARKNFPRCNKVFMSRGIECRLPFLSPGLVELALRLPMEAVRDGTVGGNPSTSPHKMKAVLARAVDGLLPPAIANRGRLAFQSGLGMREEAASVVDDPARFYRAVYQGEFG